MRLLILAVPLTILAVGLLIAYDVRRRRSRIAVLTSLVGQRLRVNWAAGGGGAYLTTEIELEGKLARVDIEARRLYLDDLVVKELKGPDPRLIAEVLAHGVLIDQVRSCTVIGRAEHHRW